MEGIPKGFKGEKEPGVIDTEKKFRYSFADTDNQFFGIRFDLRYRNLSLEELKERNKNMEYLSFREYLKQNKNLVLSPKIAEDFHLQIKMHDHLIEKIKNFKTIEELENILEDVKTYIKEDFK